MAVVYRAKQLSLDRTVAVKILPRRMSKNQEFVERFYREGTGGPRRSVTTISCRPSTWASPAGFTTSSWSSSQVAPSTMRLPTARFTPSRKRSTSSRQMAEALLHAHERGFIHRDVKPKNIMLTPKRVAKLADMGLAREATDLEAAMAEAGRAYGTPYYISPEQIRGEVNIDLRADIYSLGATFYHMVTGRVPFEAPTPSAVMHKHLKEPLTPPDHINTSLTSGCGSMIEMMMAKKADERYPSCKELLEDIALLLRGEPPRYASQHLDQDALSHLETGENVITPEFAARQGYANHAGAPAPLVIIPRDRRRDQHRVEYRARPAVAGSRSQASLVMSCWSLVGVRDTRGWSAASDLRAAPPTWFRNARPAGSEA